jgi:aspartate aminotransferase-like enzyme
MTATISKNGDRLRDKAEELRTNADNIRAENAAAFRLNDTAEELADQWDALAVTMTYLGDRTAAK